MFSDPSGNFALSLGSALYGLALAVTALVAVNETVESLPPLPANPQELLPLIGVIDIEDHLENLQDILKKKLIKDIVTKTRDAIAASKDVVVEKEQTVPQLGAYWEAYKVNKQVVIGRSITMREAKNRVLAGLNVVCINAEAAYALVAGTPGLIYERDKNQPDYYYHFHVPFSSSHIWHYGGPNEDFIRRYGRIR